MFGERAESGRASGGSWRRRGRQFSRYGCAFTTAFGRAEARGARGLRDPRRPWAKAQGYRGSGYLEAKGAAEAASRDYQAVP